MTTKRWIWAGLIAGLLALTACADKPTGPGEALPDSTILDVLREQSAFFDQMPDGQALSILEQTCDSMDEGSVEDVVVIATNAGMNPSDAGAMIVAAATGRCPDHHDSVDAWIERWGG